MADESLFVGTAGWAYKDWDGIVYPRGRRKPKDTLKYLAPYFSCIEINSSFYHTPAPERVEDWVRRTAEFDRFLFSMKLWQGFTHGKEESFSPEAVDAFGDAADRLETAGRLGAILVQFPWFFRDSAESRQRLGRIADEFGRLPLVLEVRDRSWTRPGALAAIDRMGYSFCNIDQPMAQSSLGPASFATGSIGYVRLHGRNAAAWFDPKAGRDEKYDYLYDEKELERWLPLVDDIRSKTRKTFVIANNHYKGKAAVNALELQAALFKSRVDVPEPLLEAYPRLAKISRTRFGLFDGQD